MGLWGYGGLYRGMTEDKKLLTNSTSNCIVRLLVPCWLVECPGHSPLKCINKPIQRPVRACRVEFVHSTILVDATPSPSASAVSLFLALFFSTFSMKASPALYELRTRGPLAQYKKPMSKARCLHISKTAGVTYSSTFICRLVGRMYWPNVTTSTSIARNSKSRG